ncbi:hypothetical protein HPB50_012348 [Hyalomma asiaticum]|uniref:Uncharacterized protein n=1 Tax=Hyalomma asiaticum TaxID=266040 RepID=A0ACB7S365_HYAAI|nr:hypothetical protein HPB50_012348 [Hyalomma asiaticum]
MRLVRSPQPQRGTLPRPARASRDRVLRKDAVVLSAPISQCALFFSSRSMYTKYTQKSLRRLRHALVMRRISNHLCWCLLATVFTGPGQAEAPPVFKKTTADTNVVQGGSVVLTCHATGSPKPTVKWTKPSGAEQEVVLSAAADSRILAFPNGTVLIDEVTAEDAGKYTCNATTALDQSATRCIYTCGYTQKSLRRLRHALVMRRISNHLCWCLLATVFTGPGQAEGTFLGFPVLTVVPPAWKKVPGDTEVREGGNRSFQCIAFGSPKPNVTWSKKEESRDGWMRLRADSRFSFEGSTMTIVDLQLSDTGTYSCVASNGVGQGITATFQLRVNGMAENPLGRSRASTNRPQNNRYFYTNLHLS